MALSISDARAITSSTFNPDISLAVLIGSESIGSDTAMFMVLLSLKSGRKPLVLITRSGNKSINDLSI